MQILQHYSAEASASVSTKTTALIADRRRPSRGLHVDRARVVNTGPMNVATASRFLSRWLLLAFAVLLPCAASLALEIDDTEQIKKIERQLAAALAKNDETGLKEWLADDWKFVGSDGEVTGRDDLLAAMRSGQLKFQSYELSEVKVRIYGDAAVVIGKGAAKGHLGDEAFDEHDVFTDVFIRKDGKWRCVSSHSTEVEK